MYPRHSFPSILASGCLSLLSQINIPSISFSEKCRPPREDSKREQKKMQRKGISTHIEAEWRKPSGEKQSERQAEELEVLAKYQANSITYIQRTCCRTLQKPMSPYEPKWALLSWFWAMLCWCHPFLLTPPIILHDLLLGSEYLSVWILRRPPV